MSVYAYNNGKPNEIEFITSKGPTYKTLTSIEENKSGRKNNYRMERTFLVLSYAREEKKSIIHLISVKLRTQSTVLLIIRGISVWKRPSYLQKHPAIIRYTCRLQFNEHFTGTVRSFCVSVCSGCVGGRIMRYAIMEYFQPFIHFVQQYAIDADKILFHVEYSNAFFNCECIIFNKYPIWHLSIW